MGDVGARVSVGGSPAVSLSAALSHAAADGGASRGGASVAGGDGSNARAGGADGDSVGNIPAASKVVHLPVTF